MITRRAMFGAAGAALIASRLGSTQQMRNMGGAPAGFPIHNRVARDSGKPFDFVEHCHTLGFGVVETRLPAPADPEAIKALRQKVEKYEMRLILDVGYPQNEAGIPAFDASVKAAKECGAVSLRTAMTGRRYEDMDSLQAYRANFERCQKLITLAEPILRKYRVPMGIENHKGWRSSEQAAWLKRLSSEWVQVHFDFGNNVALCEDPMDTLHNLLPYTAACHIKDMAVEMYEDGFLLSEVPLGEGFLDLKGMVSALRKKNPNIALDLEMITRDPLKIPVFTDKYWVTFDDNYSPLPARDLAHTLNLVRKNKPRSPLPRTTGMSIEAQLKLEDDNVAQSIAWARKNL